MKSKINVSNPSDKVTAAEFAAIFLGYSWSRGRADAGVEVRPELMSIDRAIDDRYQAVKGLPADHRLRKELLAEAKLLVDARKNLNNTKGGRK